RAVIAAAEDTVAVGTEGHAVHSVRVPLEGEDLLALLHVPHLQRAVMAAADKALAVGAEGHAPHRARVPLEGGELLARLRVPHLQRAVKAAADQAFAVGAEGHAGHIAGVPPESALVAVVDGPEMAIFHVAQVPLAPVQDLQRSGDIAVLPFAL